MTSESELPQENERKSKRALEVINVSYLEGFLDLTAGPRKKVGEIYGAAKKFRVPITLGTALLTSVGFNVYQNQIIDATERIAPRLLELDDENARFIKANKSLAGALYRLGGQFTLMDDILTSNSARTSKEFNDAFYIAWDETETTRDKR